MSFVRHDQGLWVHALKTGKICSKKFGNMHLNAQIILNYKIKSTKKKKSRILR